MCDTQKCLVQEDLIEDINYNSAYGWTASNYSQFWGKKLNTGLQYLLGTRYPNDMVRATRKMTIRRQTVLSCLCFLEWFLSRTRPLTSSLRNIRFL